jgi:hypothetical protein
MEGKLLAYENINLSVNENDKIQAKVGLVMHESIPGVTIPPPRDTPRNLPDRQFTGVGNLPFIYVHGGRVLEDPGDLTNGCPESHPQILRQLSYFAPSWSRWREIYCKNKRKLYQCHKI